MMIVRNVTVLFITLATLWAFPLIPDTFLNLHQVGWRVVTDNEGRARVFSDLTKARSGEHVLPEEVQTMIGLLREYDADSFRFSPGIRDNEEIMQRLVEGAYPLQVSPAAHFFLHTEQEPVPAACRPVKTIRGISLAYCP